MFPFQSGELSFQVSNNLENTTTYTTNVEQLYVSASSTTNHLLEPHNAPKPNLKSSKIRKSRSGKATHDKLNNTNNNNEGEISGNDVAKKKVLHREVERQRRQEMSNLFSSLRSLLPMDYVRGKRSVSDHVTEAANYIKDLEKNVKELGEKRDNLKESLESQLIIDRDNLRCSTSNSTTSTSKSVSNTNEYNVNIHKFSRTLQIEITAGVGEEDPYPLSGTLKVLAQEGFDVVSCVSSKVNQSWVYVIYCEVNDLTSVDSSYLQEKLMRVVSSRDS